MYKVVCNKCGSDAINKISTSVNNIDYKCTQCANMFRHTIKTLNEYVCENCGMVFTSTAPRFDTLIYTCSACNTDVQYK